MSCFDLFFIYFWLRWVFVAAHGLSLVAVSGGYSSLRCTGFSFFLMFLRRGGNDGVDFQQYVAKVWKVIR